jgi:hypothetical protein
VVNFSPFTSTAAYSPAIHGGSAYFDGSDYVVVSQGFNTSLGTRNWTVEGWIYPTTSSSGSQFAFWHYGNTIDVILISYRSDTGVITGEVRATSLSSTVLTSSTAFAKYGQWVHVAFVRESTTSVKLYTNGVLAASATIGATASYNETTLATLRYGALSNPDQSYITGYLSDWRFVKGRAVYTGAFTPPTSSLPFTADAVHQLEFNSAGIVDVSSRNVFETVGDAKIRTDVKKYGTGSMYFDGTGDYLQAPNAILAQFGSGDFTIEFWMYASSQALAPIVHQTNYASNQGWILWNYDGVNSATSTRKLTFMFNASTVLTTSSDAYTDNTWTHIAVVKSGTNVKIYSNGSSIASGTFSTAAANASTPLMIGGIINGQSWNGTAYYTGYIDDLRITNGVARYTANFTPPTSTFITR